MRQDMPIVRFRITQYGRSEWVTTEVIDATQGTVRWKMPGWVDSSRLDLVKIETDIHLGTLPPNDETVFVETST